MSIDVTTQTATSPSSSSDHRAGSAAARAEHRALTGATTTVGLLLELGRALHCYGTPAHQLEEAMSRCAETLGLEVQVFSTPTSLMAAFGPIDEQRTYLLRVEPGDVNAAMLCALDAIVQDILRGDVSVAEASQELAQALAQPRLYGPGLVTLSSAVVGGGAAALFGGHWRESVVAMFIGGLIGVLMIGAGRFRRSARLLEMLAGAGASAIAVLAAWQFGPLSIYITVVSGIVLMLPGLTFTVAVNELATRNLVAGTSRLMGAVMVLCTIGFGVAIGLQLQRFVTVVEPAEVAMPLPIWMEAAALLMTAVALMVLFSARVRDLPWYVVSALVGFYGGRLGADMFGPETGASLGAFLVAASSNAFARLVNRPAVPMMLPGIILLVPGTIGYRSVFAMLQEDVLSGVDAAFTMILVAISIVVGLLLANVAVPSRHVL